MTPRLVFIGILVAIAAASCGGTATTTSGASDAASHASARSAVSGVIDCSLVTPADLAAVGIVGAGDPSDNPDGTGHYCVYSGTSGATGGIEFDVFPHADVAEATATYQTATGEGPSGAPPAGATFDESSFAIDGDTAYLTVRQGKLVFALSVPNSVAAEAALVALATLIVQRAGDAASG